MKKNLFILLLTLLCNILCAQSYTLTRGLPVAEISGTGTAITGLGYNNSVGPFNIGFSFPFFENNYTQFYLAANGHISFGNNNANLVNSIPSVSTPNNILAFAAISWDGAQGTPSLNYFTTGVAPNRVLVVNFKNVKHSFSNEPGSLQIQLYETSGKIEIHYSSFTTSPYSRATIGIENNTGNVGVTNKDLNNKSDLALNNEAIRFERFIPCSNTVSVTTSSHLLCHGSSTITANVFPAATDTYQWYKNSVAITGATNSTYEATSLGTYFVRVTGQNNCIVQSDAIEIVSSVAPTLNVNSAYVCNAIAVNTGLAGSYTYRWLKDNTIIGGQTSASIIPQASGTYKAEVISGNCSESSNSINVSSNRVETQNVNTTLCNTINLSANLSSQPQGRTYLWTGPNNFSSTISNPFITNATAANAGVYTVTVNFGCGDIQTATTNVTVSPNTISLNKSFSAKICGTTNFNLNTSSSSPATYSWQGPNSFSSTERNATINNTASTSAGIYTVTVNFGCGDIQTATTNLTVNPNYLFISPSFSANLCSTANLYLDADHTSSRTFSWTGPNGFSSSSGGVTINNVPAAAAGIYTVTVNFGCGDSRTATTNLTVTPTSLSLNPSYSLSYCNTVNIFPEATYTQSRTYLWSGPNGFTSTTNNLAITNATAAHAGIYTVTVNFGCGDSKTATTNITVSPNNLSVNPSFLATLCNTARLYVSADYTNNRTFSWAGPNGFSSSSSSPDINNVTAAAAGIYTATVNFGCGDIQTVTTNLAINTNNISINSSFSTNLCGTANLYIDNSPTSSMTYLWTGPNGFSSTARNASVTNVTSANAGIYTVTVNFGCGDIQTATTSLTVSSNTLTVNPAFVGSNCSTVNLTANANSTPTVSYLWTGPNNFTSTQLSPSITNATTASAGIYTITVNFGCGDIKTTTTNLTINANVLTATTLSPITICGTTNLYAVASIGPPSTFSWAGPNGFSSALQNPTINNTTINNAGVYTVTANFGCNDIKTATINLTVNPNTITLSPSFSTNLCGLVSLGATTTPTSSRTYSWVGPNGFNSTLNATFIYNVTNADIGIYTLTVNFGCGDIQSATTHLSVNPNTLSINPSFSVNHCGSTSLSVSTSYTSSTTYAWAGPNGFSSTLSNPSINNADSGDAGIYTVTVNFGCGDIQTATTNLTLTTNNIWLESAASVNICKTINLYATSTYTSERTYLWTGPNGFSSTAFSPSITNVTEANEGFYTLTVNFGCGQLKTATKYVTVNPNSVTLTSNYSARLCSGVSFNVYTNANATYAWTGPNNFTSAVSNPYIPSVTNAHAGIYTVTINFGCGDVQTATTQLTVSSNTLTLNSPITTNLCGYLSGYAIASETPTRSFRWTGPNGFTSNSGSLLINNVTNANAGVYSVTVNFGCGEILTATTYVNITANTTGINPSVSAYACGNINLSSYATYTSARAYSWTGPNGFSSSQSEPVIPTATEAKAGIYTLTVNFGCGDIKTETTQVTIKPNVVSPNPTISASLCGTASLSAYTSNNNASYVWSGPNGFISTSYNPIINDVSNTHAGIYTVTVNFGCGDIKTSTTRLTVNPITLSVSHNAASYSCPGREVEFNVAWYSPRNLTASYTWTGPNGFTSTKQNPAFALTENSAGTYTVTANFGSCGISTATTTIDMYPPLFTASSPDLFPNKVLCESNSVNLFTLLNGSSTETIAGTTITNYTWNGPDNFVSHERNPTINNLTTAKAGFYTVTVNLANGCKGVYTSQIGINVTKNPELTTAYSAAFTCAGSPAILLYNTNPLGNTSVSYLWTGPDGFSSTEPRPTVPNLGSGGLYTLTATFTGGCAGTYTSVVPIFNIRKPIVQLDSIKTACLGQDLTLSPNNAASNSNLKYVWTGPNHFRNESSYALVSYSTTADMAGIYTLTITDLNGECQEPFVATQRIVLNDCTSECTLTASSSSSSYYICPGGSVFLSSRLSQIGGNYSFSWTGPNGFTSTNQNVTITDLSESMAGVYTVTVTSSLCSGTLTATTFVGINTNTATPVMNFSVGNNLCEGGGALFLIQATNGSILSYSFTGPNNYAFYGTLSYGFGGGYDQITNLTTNMSGIYTVNATFQKACSDSIYQQSASLNVVINPRPAAPVITSNSTAIEQGETTTLTASACEGNNTLKWFNSSSANPLVDKPPVTTSYWAVCQSPNCLSVGSNRINITLDSCPQQFILVNPDQNYNTGTVLKRAKTDNGNITATNFVTGNANVTYQAKSILLNAGFKADNGTVFRAEVGGCN
ncbi:PKD domain-containing protein [Emticicia sp. BO119]|uniref:PKD domain-containing protein n=1 Tax=Emticicia sp. BO119 TaxID=2757768 RepID=UPI0015F05E08|nr:PKD domain-containing protein [Emticicia sp. BO119]MBA4852992.1 PKD domain-containing protein [Emticicia sp. BO119]